MYINSIFFYRHLLSSFALFLLPFLLSRTSLFLPFLFLQRGKGIEADAAGIGILASGISVQYWCIPVPDWFRHRHFCPFRYWTDRMPGSPAFRHLKKKPLYISEKGYIHTLHVHTANDGLGYTLQCLHVHTARGGKWYPARPYCWWCKGVHPIHRHFYRQSTSLYSLALAFRHQGQSGTAGHGYVQQCPAMLNSILFSFHSSTPLLSQCPVSPPPPTIVFNLCLPQQPIFSPPLPSISPSYSSPPPLPPSEGTTIK